MFIKAFQTIHIIKLSWWFLKKDDNNLLDTLKKHSQFLKMRFQNFENSKYEHLKI